ncbi:nitrophenyl compound nitroreductase subunit ArsF family protein [Alistipes sp.]|uniref:nitrophenyl compound nitroreductase subunit ArsF family protein n=1 Tax=Alistipes sp. TaxID=1872444 RepID=UPI0025C33781|nr:nitrophenyl compound nitroreductase subunit ArsF family protein [Alistipes sp.]
MIRRLLSILALLLVACGGNGSSNRSQASTPEPEREQAAPSEQVEVLYFHGKKRCATCNAIERLTKETVEGLGRRDITVRILEIEQNEELARRYGVAWSSLLVIRGDSVRNLTRMGFSLARNRPEEFRARLTDTLTQLAR